MTFWNYWGSRSSGAETTETEPLRNKSEHSIFTSSATIAEIYIKEEL